MSKMYKNAEESSGHPDSDEDEAPDVPVIRRRKSLEKLASFDETKQQSKPVPDFPIFERKNWLLNQYFVKKDWALCNALIKEILSESDGNCEYPLFVKGQILRHEGNVQESLANFQICAKLNPNNVDYMKKIGENLVLLGKTSQAISTLDEAIKISPKDWEIYYWHALCQKNLGNTEKAKDSLKLAISLAKREEPLSLLADIFTEENDVMNAIDCYKAILEISPENADYMTKLGLLYLKTESQQQAFESIGKALGFDPNHSGAILAAGCMIQKCQDFDVALTKYRVAAQQWPDSAQLWSNIGMCFHGKKKYVAAISCLKRANYLAPLDWKILYNLGLVHYEMQQFCSAYHFLTSAINISPKAGANYGLLAVVLTHLEDYANAEKAYEFALKFEHSSPDVACNFAIFLYKKSEKEKARMMLEHYFFRVKNLPHNKLLEISKEVSDAAERLNDALRSDSNA